MSKNFCLQALKPQKQWDDPGLEPSLRLQRFIHTSLKEHPYSFLPLYPLNGGGYRSRTDDPLRARQVL